MLLIVDDHLDSANVLARLLRRLGHRAVCVSNGPEAIELILKRPPDLIILDWMMPEMDGPQVVKNIRSHPELAQIPIVFYSALNEPTLVGDALRSGAADYIVKGTPWHVVYRRLRPLLEASQKSARRGILPR